MVCPPVTLYLICEKSSSTNWIFSLQKSISKLIFAGYIGSKNPVWNRPKIQFFKIDFSKLILQKSSTDQHGVKLTRVKKPAVYHRFSYVTLRTVNEVMGANNLLGSKDADLPLSWLELPSAWAALGLACRPLGQTLAWATLVVGSPWIGMPSTWPALGLSCPWLGVPLAWANLKSQLNSEWICEVIVSPKIPTKKYRDFCPTL